MEAPSWRLES